MSSFIALLASVVIIGSGYPPLLTFLTRPIGLRQSSSPQWPNFAEARDLELRVPIECAFQPGEIHVYRFSAKAGQYFRIVVTQKGVDLYLRLFGPNGNQITEVDSPNKRNGPEPASAIAESTGSYRLEVRAFDPQGVAGRYQILLQELRKPTALDQQQIAAERILVEAETLRSVRTKDSLNRALKKYLQALPMLRATGDRSKEAETLSVLGGVYFVLGELSQSLSFAKRALLLWGQSKERSPLEVATLNTMGGVYGRLGRPKKAIECYRRALWLNHQLGNHLEEALTLRNLGVSYFPNDFAKANHYLLTSLSISREVQELPLEGNLLASLGNLYSLYGEAREALQYYATALQLQRKLGDEWEIGRTLHGLGRVHLAMGKTQKAIESFKEALSLMHRAGDREAEASILVSIGSTYANAGEPQTAISYFEKALSLFETSAGPGHQASAFNAAARTYQDVGDLKRALEYFYKAQSLYRLTRNTIAEARTLANIGAVEVLVGKREEAMLKLLSALEVQTALNDRLGQAYTFSEIGSIYSSQGKFDQAIAFFQKALSLHQAGGYKRYEADTLYRLGQIEVKRGHLDDAKAKIELAIKIIEEIRTNSFNQELRTSFSASVRNYYELYIDVLMALHRQTPNKGFDVLAFEATERARARGLLEIIRESHAEIREGVEPTLLERERSTQQQLNAKAEWLSRVHSGPYTKKQESEATKEVESLINELRDIRSLIRAKSPRYAALMQPQPFSLRDIQEKLLDENTVLVEYSLGDERSYCFVVDAKKLITYTLPGRVAIEEVARHVYKLLINKADQVDPEALGRLSRMVLYPIATQLKGKRILVVSDGALQFVPFAVLPEPAANATDLTAYVPLIVSHELVSLPSASVMVTQREQVASREAAPKKLVVLADPVFDLNDARVSQSLQYSRNHSASKQDKQIFAPTASRLKSDLGVTDFERLSTSRIEAEYVTATLQKGEYLKALDFSANSTLATNGELSQYQIVHFATHSLLNNERPELSGIVLSLVDQEGHSQDGFLRLNEIYNLKLNADLVVLSACQTAIGKDIRGEGLIGLTRGFMYAGAPRIVASLWKVNDQATAQLMKRFYERMLERGMTPAASLRAAQISLLKEKQWRAPYYWAAFVLQGEWR